MRLVGEKWGRNAGYVLVIRYIVLKQMLEKPTDDVAYDVFSDQRKIKNGA